jgi:hypothetical protein
VWPRSAGGAVHTPSTLSDLGGQGPEDGGDPGVVREKVPGPDGHSEPAPGGAACCLGRLAQSKDGLALRLRLTSKKPSVAATITGRPRVVRRLRRGEPG